MKWTTQDHQYLSLQSCAGRATHVHELHKAGEAHMHRSANATLVQRRMPAPTQDRSSSHLECGAHLAPILQTRLCACSGPFVANLRPEDRPETRDTSGVFQPTFLGGRNNDPMADRTPARDPSGAWHTALRQAPKYANHHFPRILCEVPGCLIHGSTVCMQCP